MSLGLGKRASVSQHPASLQAIIPRNKEEKNNNNKKPP